MAWTVRVKAASVGLEETGYVHQVVNGQREITVAHSTQRNYQHIHVEPLGGHHVRRTGIGMIIPDLTPHPDAVIIADALNAAGR